MLSKFKFVVFFRTVSSYANFVEHKNLHMKKEFNPHRSPQDFFVYQYGRSDVM